MTLGGIFLCEGLLDRGQLLLHICHLLFPVQTHKEQMQIMRRQVADTLAEQAVVTKTLHCKLADLELALMQLQGYTISGQSKRQMT